MKTILLFFAFFLASIAGCAQQNETEKMKTDNQTETEIIATVRRFTDLMIERNTTEMDKMVDADFTLTHITGYVQSKTEWFAEIEAETMKYYGYEEVSANVKTDGENRATIIGRNRLDARIWGSRNRWRLQQVMQLEKREGKWIILNSVASTF